MKCSRPIFAAIFGFMISVVASTAQVLPGGASSFTETHGDWRVICTKPEATVRCAISQTQVKGESRQRVLVIELTATEDDGAATGTLVLPFGLTLDAGVQFAIDESETLSAARFATCLPAGCVIPLSFDAKAVAALKKGTTLSVTAVVNSSGKQVKFPISLSGFTSALERVVNLSG